MLEFKTWAGSQEMLVTSRKRARFHASTREVKVKTFQTLKGQIIPPDRNKMASWSVRQLNGANLCLMDPLGLLMLV